MDLSAKEITLYEEIIKDRIKNYEKKDLYTPLDAYQTMLLEEAEKEVKKILDSYEENKLEVFTSNFCAALYSYSSLRHTNIIIRFSFVTKDHQLTTTLQSSYSDLSPSFCSIKSGLRASNE
jgi:predicted S18 family serine protease